MPLDPTILERWQQQADDEVQYTAMACGRAEDRPTPPQEDADTPRWVEEDI